MSGDETMVLFICFAITVVAWSAWYRRVVQVTSLASLHSGRLSVYVGPPLGLAALFLVLRAFASHDVRDSAVYLLFYMVMGAAWSGISVCLFPLLGISARDDVAERRNQAAGYAVSGALVGNMLAFAGANIGDGPGWWVVVFCTGLSGGAWFVLWFLFDWLARVSETITVERDEGAGIRLAGFLIGCGLVLGRSVAGDWVSVDATVRDFGTTAWPLLILLVIAAVVERILGPAPVAGQERPPSLVARGVLVALVYVGGALGYVWSRGPW